MAFGIYEHKIKSELNVSFRTKKEARQWLFELGCKKSRDENNNEIWTKGSRYILSVIELRS